MCIPDASFCIFALFGAPSRVVAYNIAKVQNIRCIASTLKVVRYGSIEWDKEESFSMEWNMEWKIFDMEWKKIASMEYGKISFHFIPCPGSYIHLLDVFKFAAIYFHNV